LRLIAFQIVSQVSTQEIGRQLGMSKNTVEKYLDLLAKVFILHKSLELAETFRRKSQKVAKGIFMITAFATCSSLI